MIKVLKANKQGRNIVSYTCTDGNTKQQLTKEELAQLIESKQCTNATKYIQNGKLTIRINKEKSGRKKKNNINEQYNTIVDQFQSNNINNQNQFQLNSIDNQNQFQENSNNVKNKVSKHKNEYISSKNSIDKQEKFKINALHKYEYTGKNPIAKFFCLIYSFIDIFRDFARR